MSERERLISGLKQAWRDEMASARNYRALAQREENAEKKAILLRLAEAEDKHAVNWAARLKEMGADPGEYRESVSERARRWALVQSGTDTAVVKLEALEDGADAMYDDLAKIAPSEEVRKQLVDAQNEERSHSRVLSEFTEGSVTPAQRKLNKILGTERWHVTGAGWIGQAIYGVNDGLGAAFGVVSGVAGATDVNGKFVLLSGLATAIASALSMGSGAYLATKSEREVYEAEMDRERVEIEQDPAQEREEMELFYQLKGFSAEEAKKLAAKLAERPEDLLKTLAHEELGLSEKSFPNPWKSATSAMVSTAAGAIVPVIPFMFTSGLNALVWSFVVSTVAHFAVGASKVIVTGRSWWKSGMEMTVVGLGEAVVTYCIGLLIAPVLR
ncbi:MAG TPA: VIT1/CCC1 transporter family protein [Verrucomicrobiae bacterium]|nr:VIT1/CCC1 transporter family protein [Verrucomicrobiae bacterium]